MTSNVNQITPEKLSELSSAMEGPTEGAEVTHALRLEKGRLNVQFVSPASANSWCLTALLSFPLLQTELKDKFSRLFGLAELNPTTQTVFHNTLSIYQKENELGVIWDHVVARLKEKHPTEIENLEKARALMDKIPRDIKTSILRHAVGSPPEAGPGTVVQTTNEENPSDLDSKSACGPDRKRPSSADSSRSGKRGKTDSSEASPPPIASTDHTVDMHTQGLLRKVLEFLAPFRIDVLKVHLESVVLDENSTGSYGDNSCEFIDFLGSFLLQLGQEKRLQSGEGLQAYKSFMERFKEEKKTFILIRDTMLEPAETYCDAEATRGQPANDGNTVAMS